MAESAEAQTTTSSDTAVPNHLSNLVPSFNPAEHDLEQYAQKVEMLTEIWPPGKYNELATRLFLNTTGAAFQKLQLKKSEILVGDKKGLKVLVEVLGGHWGKVNLEKKYEYAERALFRCNQRQDETNDSYLARADILWSELLAKGVTLEELRAYAVLRGSLLSSDDKKRVVVESDASGSGRLEMNKVSQAVRMLGSTFFQDFTGQKRNKGKIYDALTLHTDDADQEADTAFQAEDGPDEDLLDQWAADGDEDAILVCDYEAALQDAVQEDSDLASAYTAYQDARRRLSDRFKNRGFWGGNHAGGAHKGRGKGYKGKSKSGSGYKGSRKSLQQRILESHCRLCGKKGHWRAECPDRPRQSTGSAPPVAPTMTASTAEALSLEFLQFPEIHQEAIDDARPQEVWMNAAHSHGFSGNRKFSFWGNSVGVHTFPSLTRNETTAAKGTTAQTMSKTDPDMPSRWCLDEDTVNFASHSTFGILDSGATKSVVGSSQLAALIDGLHPEVKKGVKRCKCNITFRFGNQGTLDSQHAIVIPVGQLGLKIAIVPGQTPLLLSNTLIRTLQSQIDTAHHQLHSRYLAQPINLHLNPKGLFLVDLNELALNSRGAKVIADTFAHETSSPVPPGKVQADATVVKTNSSQNSHDMKIVQSQNEINMKQTETDQQCNSHQKNISSAVNSSDRHSLFRDSSTPVQADHEPSRSIVASADQQPGCRELGGLPAEITGGDACRANHIWQGTCREDILRDLDKRDTLAEVVPQDIRGVHQGGAPAIDPLLSTDDRKNRVGVQHARDGAGPSDPALEAQVQAQGRSQDRINGDATRVSKIGRGGSGVMGSRTTDSDHRECPCSSAANVAHGERHDRSPESPERPKAVDPFAAAHGLRTAGDIDADEIINFSTDQQKLQRKFNQQIEMMTKELKDVQKISSNENTKKLHILEVFCSTNSEIAKQANNMGYRGRRFSLAQGDLSTRAARRQLFQILCTEKPKDVWFSPTCGPWSSWSNFNEKRSLDAFDEIQQQREQQLYQLALGIVILRFQFSHGNHMHWEQPKRSLMFSTPLLKELYTHTYSAMFDMCNVGGLTDPINNKPIQKGTCVRTTSMKMYEQLHGRNCKRDHEHQQLEGSFKLSDKPINRTAFSERYTRRFARYVTKTMVKSLFHRDPPKGYHEFQNVFAASDEKRLREHSSVSSEKPAKRAKFHAATLIEPDQIPRKRRRMAEKAPHHEELPPVDLCNKLITAIKAAAPKVGRKMLNDTEILNMTQNLFHDKQIMRIQVAKGTERKLAPPKDLMPLEAPFRRSIAVLRTDHSVKVEDSWEEWENLPQCRLVSKFVSCFLLITVYAANLHQGEENPQRMQETQMDQSTTSERSCMPSPSEPQMQAANPAPNPEAEHPTEEQPLSTQIDAQSETQGPRFRALPSDVRQFLIKIHKNLGHPQTRILAQILRQQGHSSETIQGLEDMKCSVCQKHQEPKIQRPSTIKHEMDFGDKISMDGVTWTNKNNKTFHFYHFLDHGTNYHTAIVAPNRSTDRAVERFIAGWLTWAGPPNELLTDSATEFTAAEFGQQIQQLNIKCTNIPPGAHWQLGKTERHGDILQHMLSKYEEDHPIESFQELQTALAQCTAAKNACSLKHGFAPEVLVFGKGLRTPGSLSSDEQLPAHLTAISENAHGIEFRKVLSFRESARKAFYDADNNMSIRRAALRRTRPDRGQYEPGEWVMYWRKSETKQGWLGPAKVVQQDAQHSVFCLHLGTLIRAAPEHIRPVSALEAKLVPESEMTSTHVQNRVEATPQAPEVIPTATGEQQEQHTSENQPNNNQIAVPSTNNNPTTNSSSSSSDQPDQEPEAPSENIESQQPEDGTNIPVPESDEDEELICDTLLSIDDDVDIFQSQNQDQRLGWKCEFDIDTDMIDINLCATDEIIMLASSQKKAKNEVKLCQLNKDELAEFEKAKEAEVANWLKTGTVSKALRNSLSPEQILRCRWIHVWKPLEDKADQAKHGGRSRKAKSRLVVLGYLDPELESIPRDSPTLGRQSRMLILQLIASCQWSLMSFDIKAAFLQGKTQENRQLGIEPVPELRRAMNLRHDEVCRLEKSAYGLIDAPYLWFKELDKSLKELGFISAPFDPCVYILYAPNSSKPSGVLGVHVDDGLCGGDQYFQNKVSQLETKFPFGSKKSQSFTFTGIDMQQLPDKSIVLSQEKYITKIEPIRVAPDRKYSPEEKVTEDERLALRGIIGSLQYASVHTRPDLSSRLSFIQSQINTATINTLNEANKILHEAKRHKQTSITIKPIELDKLRFLAFSDASFTSKKQPDSHTGMVIMATHADIAQHCMCPVSPISWGCKKIQKVVTSTLAAETASLSTTLDQLSWLRLFWGWLLNPNLEWKKSKDTLNKLPETIAISTKRESDIAVTDCKSLYDLVTRTAPPNCQEFRTQLQARAIKDLLSEGVDLHWVHSGAQVADALTKVMESSFLRHTLELGMYKLHDEAEILKERATARNRVRWLQEQSNTSDWKDWKFSNFTWFVGSVNFIPTCSPVIHLGDRFIHPSACSGRLLGWGQPKGV